MKTPTLPQADVHGEFFLFESSIPDSASILKVDSPYLIVADSETTGNHHVIDCAEGVEFFESNGTRYMKNSKPATLRCLHPDRHSPVTVPPGEYEFGIQQEYDPFAANMRNVAD